MQLYNRFILPIIITCLTCTLTAVAQDKVKKQIVGIVVDRDTGEPLPLSNVYIKGTTIGVVSDFDGKSRLSSKRVWEKK